MGKSSTETVETRLDPGAAAYRDFVASRTKQLAGSGFQGYGAPRIAGLDPAALAGYNALIGGDASIMNPLRGLVGNLGLAGQPLDISQFMDPYLGDVVGGVQGDFDRTRAQTLASLGASATHAGAFGGDRMALAQGTALGEIAREEGSVLGQLRSQGHQFAVQSALQNRSQLAGLGMSAAQMLNALQQQSAQAGIALGETQRGIGQAGMDFQFQEFMRRINQPYQNLSLLQGTMQAMPYGQTQSTTSQGSWLNSLAGLGMIGASFIPGAQGFAGSLIGAGSGLLG